MCMWGAVVGASIYVKSVAFVVRNQACLRNTYGHTLMWDPTSASAAILHLKLKVGFSTFTFKHDCNSLRQKNTHCLLLGNLTKHMKSKAHMKKCLELGVSPTAMDNTEDAGRSLFCKKLGVSLAKTITEPLMKTPMLKKNLIFVLFSYCMCRWHPEILGHHASGTNH